MSVTMVRRHVLGGALAGTLLLAGCGRRKTPYDDLLALLDDRDEAARLGAAVVAEKADIDKAAVAASLRARLKNGSLADVAGKDAAAGRVIEGHGWVLPETVALISALAAAAQ